MLLIFEILFSYFLNTNSLSERAFYLNNIGLLVSSAYLKFEYFLTHQLFTGFLITKALKYSSYRSMPRLLVLLISVQVAWFSFKVSLNQLASLLKEFLEKWLFLFHLVSTIQISWYPPQYKTNIHWWELALLIFRMGPPLQGWLSMSWAPGGKKD